MTRRRFLTGCAGVMTAGCALDTSARAGDDILVQAFADVERRAGGRFGAFVQDTGTGRSWTRRADERFPLASTFKAFACAATLARVDAGEDRLDARVTYGAEALLPHSPVTQLNVARGLTVAELCAAATAVSDNTAANLLLVRMGGPEGLTAYMRRIGDGTTRLDRWETALNEATPGDPRDTTSPAAAAASLSRLLLGEALSPGSRRQLTAWLEGNQVSGALLRAGLPRDWRTADRSGAGGHGTRGLIAVTWPPGRPAVVVALYVTQTALDLDARDAAFAQIGRALASTLA